MATAGKGNGGNRLGGGGGDHNKKTSPKQVFIKTRIKFDQDLN